MIAFHGVHISFNRLDRSIMVGNGCMIPIVKINDTLDFDRFTLYLPAAENSMHDFSPCLWCVVSNVYEYTTNCQFITGIKKPAMKTGKRGND